jgi:hypothetical protein
LFPAEVINEAFPGQSPVNVDSKEADVILRLCTLATLYSFEELQTWWESEVKITSSIVYRTISNFFSEVGLWAGINWHQKRNGSNEDSFIQNLLKPLLAGAFGTFAGCMFRW